MGKSWLYFVAAWAVAIAAPCSAAAFDPAPWLQDLEQARAAFHGKYANWDWAETERELNIDALFDQAAERVRNARNETDAKAAFERISTKLGDGHVEFEWPSPPQEVSAAGATGHAAPRGVCDELGFDSRQNGLGTAQHLPGYTALSGGPNIFDAGTVPVGGTNVGVIRIGVFQPQGYPQICHAVAQDLAIPNDKPCEDACEDKLMALAYDRLTAALEGRVRQLKAAGATALLVDITNNGGGSEWAEAVARILTPHELVSGRRGFIRGEHWATSWRALGQRLRSAALKASPADRRRLLAWAAEADAALVQAETPCPSGSTGCERIVKVGYATGLVGSARAGSFRGKEWGPDVFTPAQYNYDDGVWTGPLIVLVDEETWSAAEEFAAILQDNRSAVILGARTGGAGCGHIDGGTPVTLRNSRAVLQMPDCVRYRADGSNEVRGIIPDQLVAIRRGDGSRLRGQLIAARLPAAIAEAKAMSAEPPTGTHRARQSPAR